MCDIKNKSCKACLMVFWVCLVTSIGLIVTGFFIPPIGSIDGSVLTAVGELIAFPAIFFAFRAIQMGYDAKLTHGNTTIELSN